MGRGRLTHCGERGGECLGALPSKSVEEEDTVRAEEVEAIGVFGIYCPMKDSQVHQGQNMDQLPFLFLWCQKLPLSY